MNARARVVMGSTHGKSCARSASLMYVRERASREKTFAAQRILSSRVIAMTNPGFTHRLLNGLRGGGVKWLASAIGHRLIPPRVGMQSSVIAAVANQNGLEIGGPSRVFEAHRLLPVYPAAACVDNVNFSVQTSWEQNLHEGGEFRFDPQRSPGRQWIRDATALTGIADQTYDFILSSHCLEHVANPLRALHEWHRVTRSHGHLVLLLPDPAHTFDHRRPATTLAHLRDDSANNVGEDDVAHVAEVLALHDLLRDPWAGSLENFRERVQHNAANRCIHHHVFNLPLMSAMLEETGWRVLATEKARPVHLVAFAQKA